MLIYKCEVTLSVYELLVYLSVLAAQSMKMKFSIEIGNSHKINRKIVLSKTLQENICS